ncbi:MAG: RodZ domain-containing protein [Candidatus Doudnabacteria bacterium]
MTSFSSKKIQGETFGEILKKKRKSMGYTLKQVSHRLKINFGYLKALEAESLQGLPPPVYVRGFLKHYARFLGLPEETILRYYRTERNILDNLHPEANLVYQSKIKRVSLLNISPKAVKLGFIALGIVMFFIYLGWELSGFSAPPSLKIISPQENEKVTTDSVVVAGESEKEAEVFINGQPVFVDQEGNFREQIILNAGVNPIEILARNKIGRERRVARNVLVYLPANVGAVMDAVKENKEEKLQELSLLVKIKEGATWISVDTDGTNVFQGTMLPETSREFKARDKITITSGRAGNTYIVFNGQDLGSLGEDGDVVRNVEFTKDLKVPDKTQSN